MILFDLKLLIFSWLSAICLILVMRCFPGVFNQALENRLNWCPSYILQIVWGGSFAVAELTVICWKKFARKGPFLLDFAGLFFLSCKVSCKFPTRSCKNPAKCKRKGPFLAILARLFPLVVLYSTSPCTMHENQEHQTTTKTHHSIHTCMSTTPNK